MVSDPYQIVHRLFLESFEELHCSPVILLGSLDILEVPGAFHISTLLESAIGFAAVFIACASVFFSVSLSMKVSREWHCSQNLGVTLVKIFLNLVLCH